MFNLGVSSVIIHYYAKKKRSAWARTSHIAGMCVENVWCNSFRDVCRNLPLEQSANPDTCSLSHRLGFRILVWSLSQSRVKMDSWGSVSSPQLLRDVISLFGLCPCAPTSFPQSPAGSTSRDLIMLLRHLDVSSISRRSVRPTNLIVFMFGTLRRRYGIGRKEGSGFDFVKSYMNVYLFVFSKWQRNRLLI